jgi:uncharacterized protein (TIGR02266 family)
MAGEQDPQDDVNHVQTARNAAARARTLLSPVLRQLQEAALGIVDLKIQARLLRAAEQVAETSGMLYELEHGNKNTFDNLAGAVRARDHLRTALSALQAPEMAGSFPPECADVVASALAIVFAAARGGDWKDRELLRRARKRALMMRVPVASGDDDGSRPPPSKVPDSMAPIPLSRRASASRGAPPTARRIPPASSALSKPPSARSNLYADSERTADPRKWNRRLTGRTVLEVDVGFVSDSQFYAGLSMDLSTGGLFVATYQLKPVGTRVAVSLVMPDGHAVWAKGMVRWVREPRGDDVVPGIGVEFTEIEPEDLEAVKRFCAMRAPMYFDSEDE